MSQGTGLPKSAFEAWGGFTLCCGFAVYRPEAKTLSFMRKVAGYSGAKQYDDQIALNSVLMDNKLVWEQPRTQYFIENGKRRIRCFPEELTGIIPEGDLTGLRVVLLPHSTYRRMPNSLELSEPKVFHPLPDVRKVARGIKQSLKDNGLWGHSEGKVERTK
jgi:predicted ATP-grasp superfamily ATP-dependent carboligase